MQTIVMWDPSLHPEHTPLSSSFSPPCLVQLLVQYVLNIKSLLVGGQWGLSHGSSLLTTSLLPPPSHHPSSAATKGLCSTNSTALFGLKTDMSESSSVSKLLANGHTQNIKVIIFYFYLIFLCSVPIFFVNYKNQK